MPILASLRPAAPRPVYVPPQPRRLEFQSLDGATRFVFDSRVEILSDVKGLEVPPREISTSGAGPGGMPRIDVIQDQPADTSMILLGRGTRRQLRGDFERLRRFLDHRRVDYALQDGTFDLVAVDEDGREFLRRCAYKSGLEGDYGNDKLHGEQQRQKWPLVLTSVWPYWRGEQWTTGVVQLPRAEPFFSTDPEKALFGQQRLGASRVLGDQTPVDVRGNVDSLAAIELKGPFTSARIRELARADNPRKDLLDFTVGTLGETDRLVIDTGRQPRRVLNDGATNSGAALIGRGQTWAPLSPGRTYLSFDLLGPTEATSAEVSGQALYESPWVSEGA